MRLNLKTTQKKVYRQIVEIIRSIPPLNTLRNRELDVLAILMYYNFKYKNVEETIRWRIIHDLETRKEMQKDIEISEDSFANNLSLIRRAGLLDENNRIPKFLQIYIDDRYEISFNFKISKDEL
jgi:hypothetical protein